MTGGVERVVVALDAASENRTAIAAAARLAARWKAHLHGVFVEDDDLLRLAALPFARQVTLGWGVEAIDLQQARWQTHAFAEHARRELAAAARRHGVEWSFEVMHEPAANHITAITTTDFMVYGTTTRPIGNHFRVECRWWSAIGLTSSSLLLAHRDRPDGAIAVLLEDREPASERLIAVAGQFAEEHGGRLIVISASELANAPGFRSWLDDRLAGHAVTAELELRSADPASQRARMMELGCRVVAVAAGATTGRAERLRELIAEIACDVLVVC